MSVINEKHTEQIDSSIEDNRILFYDTAIKYGKAAIGEQATLAQIANYVAPQFGFTSNETLNLFMSARRIRNERSVG